MLGFDLVIIKMHLNEMSLYVGVIYRPPNLSLPDTKIVCDVTRSKISGNEVNLMGDFNLPGIDWASNNLLSTCTHPRESETFLELIDDLFIYQHIYIHTQGMAWHLWCIYGSFISTLSVRPPLNGSDHCVLVFNY